MNTRVRLYGEFRNYLDQPEIEITLEEGATAQELKKKVESLLRAARPSQDPTELLRRSVVADTEGILKLSEKLPAKESFALLPPVCGG